ncbi:arylsulfotransferase family protein [Actinoallomurus spadix]|uniref:Arylsulfotransferase ASST n=1 Tax=Actinoallomurus spadix TaxID=79912 RepID=A0ABN0VWF1_9ACTN|nr:arylsulfotransferase family protein [Actinoallomurus spadix]MCO5985859.1 arylsulfotransferase family protein [Actinoallomurus spadix]
MSRKKPRPPGRALGGAVTSSVLGLTALGAVPPPAVVPDPGTAHRALPAAPELRILRHRPGAAPGMILITPQSLPPAPRDGNEILDGQGRPVWFRPVPARQFTTDLRVQRYRGRPVLTWLQGALADGVLSYRSGFAYDGTGYIADTHYRVIATVRHVADPHELQLTPRNTVLLIGARNLRMDLTPIGGTRNDTVRDGVLKEVDVATGRTLWRWSAADHIPVTENHHPGLRPHEPRPYDYLHLNSVDEGPDGTLLVSAMNTCAVYKVDRRTGRIIWRLGGRESTFRLGPGVRFCGQHDAHWAGENLIRVFDNGTLTDRHASRVAWIRLDPRGRTATLVRQIVQPRRESVAIQGNAQELPNGDTAVGWGSTGRISEFSPGGSRLFDAALPEGVITYRMYRLPWNGRPCTPPAVIPRGRTVHAVWNGATGVARWRVLTGPTRKAAKPVAEAAWNGLDTAITLPGTSASAPYVQVEALDAHGRLLGVGARGRGESRMPPVPGRPGTCPGTTR